MRSNSNAVLQPLVVAIGTALGLLTGSMCAQAAALDCTPRYGIARDAVDVCSPWVCFGLLAGASFLAQPVKLLTSGVGTTQWAAVGATIFRRWHAVPRAVPRVLAASMRRRRAWPASTWLALGSFALGISIRRWVLIPALDARLVLMQAGKTPADSPHHGVYVGRELKKLLSMLALGCMRMQPRPRKKILGDAQ